MSQYTAAITARVSSQFPLADGYTALTQTQLIALGEACAALVDPASFADELDWSIEGLIEANTFFNQVPKDSDYYEQLRDFCEYCENLAIANNTSPGSGARSIFGYVSQSSTSDPVFDHTPGFNNTGELPQLKYVAPGFYQMKWTTDLFADGNKVKISFMAPPDGSVVYWGIITSSKIISIFSARITANTLSGAIETNQEDGLFNSTWVQIDVLA